MKGFAILTCLAALIFDFCKYQRRNTQFHVYFQYERQKKMEREHKKKQEALSREETKDEIVKLEQKLANYKTEKHELFYSLKKVLYEDDTRRRAKEAPHPNLYLQPTARNAPGMYKMGHTQLLIQPATRKLYSVKRKIEILLLLEEYSVKSK